MSFTASIPVAQINTANATLMAGGFGPNNFGVPVWTNSTMPSVASMECLANFPTFQAACAALPGATIRTLAGLISGMTATATAMGGRWGSSAPLLQGNVTPGLYRATPSDGGGLWMVIQAFNRAITTNPLPEIPALVRFARVPGEVLPWVQPLDQFDAYYVVNAFTGLADEVTHNGQTWRCSQQSAAGGFNTFAPGVFGWVTI